MPAVFLYTSHLNGTRKTPKTPLDEMTRDVGELEERFPHLVRELRDPRTPSLRVDGVEESKPVGEDAAKEEGFADPRSVPDPCARDFLARCSTEEEALEIIEFLARRGEISDEERATLLEQLKRGGPRAFGEKRTWGYYEREFRRRKSRLSARESPR
ncbi:MAG: hypothetical protein Kow0069_32080 [Promethearchaeota archaeon]